MGIMELCASNVLRGITKYQNIYVGNVIQMGLLFPVS